jgi:hypothetical protein
VLCWPLAVLSLVLASIRSARYVEATEHAVDILPPDIRGTGGTEVMKLVYAALSDASKKPAASQALQDLIRKMEFDGIDPSARGLFVQMFTMLGALDPAYRSYDEFARFGPVNIGGSIWAPEMRAFRKDPRFQQVVTRENLIEYWKQYGPPDDCDLQDDKLTCR